jgi:hypothetical protein
MLNYRLYAYGKKVDYLAENISNGQLMVHAELIVLLDLIRLAILIGRTNTTKDERSLFYVFLRPLSQ